VGRSLPAHFLAAFTSSFLHSFIPRFIPGLPTDTILHFIAINILSPRFRFFIFYFLFTFLREEFLFPLSFPSFTPIPSKPPCGTRVSYLIPGVLLHSLSLPYLYPAGASAIPQDSAPSSLFSSLPHFLFSLPIRHENNTPHHTRRGNQNVAQVKYRYRAGARWVTFLKKPPRFTAPYRSEGKDNTSMVLVKIKSILKAWYCIVQAKKKPRFSDTFNFHKCSCLSARHWRAAQSSFPLRDIILAPPNTRVIQAGCLWWEFPRKTSNFTPCCASSLIFAQ
jgi:hypothetical protein